MSDTKSELYRNQIAQKIKEYEKNGWWDKDVESDEPPKELTPDKIDYLNKKLKSKVATCFANLAGTVLFEKMIKKGDLVIKGIFGIENFTSVKGGAIITCNHFSISDHYCVWRAIKPYMGKKRLWKVIKEGNYTCPPKPFGFVMRNCNTLPLSRNIKTMQNFISAVKTLTERGEKILIYPEQSMWRGYKKPRPLQDGAFNLAVISNVPVIPVFITTKDSGKIDAQGFPIQENYIHFLPPVYPEKVLSRKDNIRQMKEKNYSAWKGVYKRFYNKELIYDKN